MWLFVPDDVHDIKKQLNYNKKKTLFTFDDIFIKEKQLFLLTECARWIIHSELYRETFQNRWNDKNWDIINDKLMSLLYWIMKETCQRTVQKFYVEAHDFISFQEKKAQNWTNLPTHEEEF